MSSSRGRGGLAFAIIVALLTFAGVSAAINSAAESVTSSDNALP